MTLVCASTIDENLAFVRCRRGTINTRSPESDRTALSDHRTLERRNEKNAAEKICRNEKWIMSLWKRTLLRFGALKHLISCLWHFFLFLLANWYKLWGFVFRPSSFWLGKFFWCYRGLFMSGWLGRYELLGKQLRGYCCGCLKRWFISKENIKCWCWHCCRCDFCWVRREGWLRVAKNTTFAPN